MPNRQYVPPRPGDKLPPDELKELRQLEDRATQIEWLYPWDREDERANH